MIAQSVNPRKFNQAKYAEGVFIAMTGGAVHDFDPLDKRLGYTDALKMTQHEKGLWFDWCIANLGYVDPFMHWSDRHCGGEIL